MEEPDGEEEEEAEEEKQEEESDETGVPDDEVDGQVAGEGVLPAVTDKQTDE